jgi:predicted lipoprotein with Yx(FWY)xxD motif
MIAMCTGLTFGIASCGGPTTTSTTTTVGSHGPAFEITTGTVSGLGTVLVDGQGYTLYLFVPDAHSGHSVCTGICAVEWPPLTLPKGTSAPKAGPGVNPSLLGTTTRTDGSVQVTYNNWPLYTWPDDISPGQATGQGLNNVGGLWYVVSPQGDPIRS